MNNFNIKEYIKNVYYLETSLFKQRKLKSSLEEKINIYSQGMSVRNPTELGYIIPICEEKTKLNLSIDGLFTGFIIFAVIGIFTAPASIISAITHVITLELLWLGIYSFLYIISCIISCINTRAYLKTKSCTKR